jgi:hypothetical protein
MRHANDREMKMDNGKIDLWVRQLTLMAVLLVALALIVIGVLLYAPRAHATHCGERNQSAVEVPRRDGLPGGEGVDADISSRDTDQSTEDKK